MRNLLGRLNARPSDDLVRIANFWRVALPGTDRGRHVGVIYRVMTDIRACREAWERFNPTEREIIRLLAASEAGPMTIAEMAGQLESPEEGVRESAVQLFRHGLLSVQGDNQELPVGERPRLFLPRELGQDYRRILDEIAAVRHVMHRANHGDLVILCVDDHSSVMSELENRSPYAQPGAGAGSAGAPVADPDYTPPSEGVGA